MIVAAIFAIALFAFAVSAVAGGGAGLVLVPLLRILLPVAQVPVALSIGTAAGSLARIHAFRAHVRWDVVRRFVPSALPMAGIGAWALSQFQPAYVELLIGLFLLANLPLMFLRRGKAEARKPPLPTWALMLLGALAGLISGFTGAVGLLFNGAYRRMGMSKEELVATRAANEIALHLLKIALYASLGLLSWTAFLIGLMVAAAAIIAAYGMRRLLPYVSEPLFRLVSNLAMIAAGAAMFIMSSDQIMRLHNAFARTVTLGEEQEFQLYWSGHRRFVLEFEEDGTPVLERGIDADDLSKTQAAQVRALESQGRVVLIERVYSWRGNYIEVYLSRDGQERKVELR